MILHSRLTPPLTAHNRFILEGIRNEVIRFIEQEVKSRVPKPRLLDYGAGDSPYFPLFDGIVSEYVRCDIPLNASADIHLDPSGRIPLPDGSVDVILSIQVLEHVDDVARCLAEKRRVLAEDGVMFLSTHGQWIYHPFPKDLWRWTVEGLTKVVTDAGFAVKERRWIMGPLAYALQMTAFSVKWRFEGKGGLFLPMVRAVCFLLNALMPLAERIDSDRAASNAALYFLTLTKKGDLQA